MALSDLTEDTVALVLTRNRGDLVSSSQTLNVRPSKLIEWIRSVPSVAVLWQTMDKVKRDPEFDNLSQAQFNAEIAARTAAYRLDGLEVIHELAVTDHEGVSGMADVRLKAAMALRGASDLATTNGDGVLAELNTLYYSNARRIKSMRAVQIEFSDSEDPPHRDSESTQHIPSLT